MEFIFSTKNFIGSEKNNNYYFKGDFYIEGNNYFFFKPTLYEIEKTSKEYLSEFLKDKKKFISSLNGEFLLFYYNGIEDKIFFATDHLGKELGLYYFNEANLILTNSFWDGIRIISPTQKDIDIQSVKETIVYTRAFLHNTIIKNYYFLPPATYIEIDLNNISINLKKYWDMKYLPDNSLVLDDVVDKIESCFDGTFKMLKEKYPGDTKFGVGLSGGLDSRLISFYAQKYNLKLVPYCIGQKYGRLFIKSSGYKLSKKIAKLFKLNNMKFINYNAESYFNKIYYDVKYIPFFNSNFEINPLAKIPDFDIMLNGEHGGVFFGEFKFQQVLDYSKNNIEEFLVKFLSFTNRKELVMSEDEVGKTLSKVRNYINGIKTNNRYNIFYRFFFEILGSKTQRGFFESTMGLKKSYTPFLDPKFFNFYLTWENEFLIDRVLQKKLFKKHYTQLSKIQDESYDAPLYWREDSPKFWPIRFFFALKYLISGHGLRRADWLRKDREFKLVSKNILSKNTDFVDKHFPNMNFDLYLKENPRAAANFIKMKVATDIIIEQGFSDIKEFMNEFYNYNINSNF